MPDTGTEIKEAAAVPLGVDGAVGVGSPKWFVAIVNSRHEKKVAQYLEEAGVETYVALQKELRVWKNGRRKLIDRVVIPSVVFIRCNETRRRELVELPYINRFMVNRAVVTDSGRRPVATIPAHQLSVLRFMLGQEDHPVRFEPTAFKVTDNVRVIRGKLRGLEGRIMSMDDGTHILTVGLDLLGGASVRIDPTDVERI